MIVHFIVSLAALAHASPHAAVPAPLGSRVAPVRLDEEFDKRFADAGSDVEKLWQLHLWCKETSRSAESRTVLKKVIELSPDHEEARKALGHHRYDNQWFETYTALAKYKRDQEAKLKADGKAIYKEQIVPLADVPYLRMGWTQDADKTWRSPHEIEQRTQEAKFVADGWQMRPDEESWVAPEDFDKWKAGLWKCGDKWLPIEEANQYHAQLFQWWRVKGPHFTLNTTCDRNPADARQSTLDWSLWWIETTFADLKRLYGIQPAKNPELLLLRSKQQYLDFGAGDPNKGIPPNDSSGFSSCHFAYFADALFDPTVTPMEYRGQGVGYWADDDPVDKPFGPFSVRHAAGLSYAEAIDPSLDAISRAVEASAAQGQGPAQGSAQAFWTEKKIPRWMRYGGASYVERYFADPQNPNEPMGLRNWAIANLKNQGERLPLEQVFALTLDPNDQDASRRVISSAGLVVAFMLDGKCKPVMDAHQAFKAALASGKDVPKAVEDLQAALIANEAALKEFAGF
jgi:hypothetical protein